jgi:hypothetical protein
MKKTNSDVKNFNFIVGKFTIEKVCIRWTCSNLNTEPLDNIWHCKFLMKSIKTEKKTWVNKKFIKVSTKFNQFIEDKQRKQQCKIENWMKKKQKVTLGRNRTLFSRWWQSWRGSNPRHSGFLLTLYRLSYKINGRPTNRPLRVLRYSTMINSN